jgi:hypothetical protein
MSQVCSAFESDLAFPQRRDIYQELGPSRLASCPIELSPHLKLDFRKTSPHTEVSTRNMERSGVARRGEVVSHLGEIAFPETRPGEFQKALRRELPVLPVASRHQKPHRAGEAQCLPLPETFSFRSKKSAVAL